MPDIFNSLGSNYDGNFVKLASRLALPIIRNFFFPRSYLQQQQQKLITQLESFFAQPASTKPCFLFYKGRDAIEFVLRSWQIKTGDQVLTQAFTCYAIEQAITKTGAKPVYVDLAPGQLNPDVTNLEQARQQAPHAKAVIIQHTLGSPAAIESIKKWCTKHQLLLLEDLAQSFGASSNQQTPPTQPPSLLGQQADAIVLSFGRDKVIDTVSGGAALVKTTTAKTDLTQLYQQMTHTAVPQWQMIKDLTYPGLTLIIRSTYQWGLGKILHKILTKIGWFTNPIHAPLAISCPLPAVYAPLVLYQLQQHQTMQQHRRQIAEIYLQQAQQWLTKSNSDSSFKPLTTLNDCKNGSALRFNLVYRSTTPDWTKIFQQLAQQQFFLSDRWYRHAVDCGKLNCSVNYQSGSCPNAEQLAQQIINLPTHQAMTTATAKRLMKILATFKLAES